MSTSQHKSQFQSQFLQIIEERGYLNQITHSKELDELMAGTKIAAYIGFDCTAASLHVGSLIQIMILRILQECGHQPIVLLGGGTTKIGDPSGKDEARQLLDEKRIAENLKGIEATLRKFDLSLTDKKYPEFKFVNNDEWLSGLNYIEFLRDFGRHFSVNRMLSFDSVKLRLEREQPLSFLEFNYMILQSYDFYILNQKYNCKLQIGGSDQWGNIVNGVDLTRKIDAKRIFCEGVSAYLIGEKSFDNEISKNAVFGLTTPLLTTSDGKKMGKTADGAVWLSGDMLSPFDYFQYFRNISDSDTERFTKYFTDVNFDSSKNINESKEILAFQATKICHGKKIADEVLQKAREIFVSKNAAAYEPKEILIDSVQLKEGKKITEIIKELEILESSSEAKRMIEGGAVKINDNQIKDINYKIHEIGEFNLSVGKKKFFRISVKNK